MGTIKPSVRYTLIHNDRSQGRYQECGYVRGHANRCCRMRHSGTREIQHRKGHCSLHQKGIRQKNTAQHGIALSDATLDRTLPTRQNTLSTSILDRSPFSSSSLDRAEYKRPKQSNYILTI